MMLHRFPPWRPAAALSRLRALNRDRRGVIALMFGLVLIPLLLLVGLAVDFAFIAQAHAQLDQAADTAALTAAKTAGTAFTNGVSTSSANTQGQTAGAAWFTAQVGTVPDLASVTAPTVNPAVTVSVTNSGNAFTATVSYTAEVSTIFEKLFGVSVVTISNTAAAEIVANAYVDVTFLLDNSSSMLIAATDGSGDQTTNGVATLQPITAASSCFQVSKYTGKLNSSGLPISPYGTANSYNVSSGNCGGISYTCTQSAVAVSSMSNTTYNINGLQGCQCAFACHWLAPTTGNTFQAAGVDTESGSANTAGSTQTYSLDYYGLARNAGVQLRFDVVQLAVETALNYMAEPANERIANQFGAAVYEFNNSFTPVWPPTADSASQATTDMTCLTSTASGCTGNALAAAQAIATPVVSDAADTNFPAAMAALVADTTAAGDGSTQAKAKKSLIIVTDGIQDWGGRTMVNGYSLAAGTASNPNGAEGPISMHDCDAIKALGYTVYVLYTPYYVPPPASLDTLVINNTALDSYVNGTTGTAYDLPTNLQGCSSGQGYYASASNTNASDPDSIQATLQTMVQAAINSGARLTL
jgi:Flp pilus assembly protein TadG